MSGTRNVPIGTDIPPPLVPLPSCHARVKQLQARLFNGLPLTTSYIANCRLCLSSNFGEKSTTIIEDKLCSMLKQVFPFPITNQIGLPMNVCAECHKAVQMFYGYSIQVLANQKKLQETLIKTEHFEYNHFNKAILERAQHPDTHREAVEQSCHEMRSEIKSEDESQGEDCQDETLIDVDVQCKTQEDDVHQGEDPLSEPSLDEKVSLRSVRRIVLSKPPTDGNVTGGINLIECKTKEIESKSVTHTQKTNPALLEFTGARKKARLSPGEVTPVGKSSTEPNETEDDDANCATGPKPVYICSICAKVFDKHRQLICHQKTHLMRECSICKKMIAYGKMTQHILKDHAVINRQDESVK
ncbi:uncharacterized protein LOC126560989 [Anopheles maculipalpis]|uniref:uncharacterized protein LOC126560989 n=1 Tax=Anopheles maculipalpis TaxID=1496333 RepID=UPI00215972A7|nr:uncharacterized protein LOC126560989 [Anopheles maculipalpis]